MHFFCFTRSRDGSSGQKIVQAQVQDQRYQAAKWEIETHNVQIRYEELKPAQPTGTQGEQQDLHIQFGVHPP